MNEGLRALLAFVSAAFGLAILSVIVSHNAATASVISAGGSALSGVINAATSPVTGSTVSGAGNLGSALASAAAVGNFDTLF